MDAHGVLARQFPEYSAQEMRGCEFVIAMGRDEQATGALYSTAKKAYEVEGGLVGPMQILQNHDAERIGRGQSLEQPGEKLLPRQIEFARRIGRQ